jgi:hypothetical protein
MRSLLSPFLLIPACAAFLLPSRGGGLLPSSTPRQQSRLLLQANKVKAPLLDDVCETLGVTLTRFMNEVTMLNPELRELSTIFGAIDTACKAISNEVKRSQLPSRQTLGYQQGGDGGNVPLMQNEDQKARRA